MKRHTQRVMHSSSRSDWRTPRALYNALDDEFDFTVDVAADDASSCCLRWFGPGGESPDGLAASWADERCFMNPPYAREQGQAIDPWVERAFRASLTERALVVGILPFSPQTRWYRWSVWGLSDAGEWRGHAAVEERRLPRRVTFLGPTGRSWNAPGNTAIVIWRPRPRYVGPWAPTVRYWSW